jgi:hypothetical protein
LEAGGRRRKQKEIMLKKRSWQKNFAPRLNNIKSSIHGAKGSKRRKKKKPIGWSW